MSLEITKHIYPSRGGNGGNAASIHHSHAAALSPLSVSAAASAMAALGSQQLQQQAQSIRLLDDSTADDSICLEPQQQAEATGEINLPLLATAND
ncbi:MAG: hypothetical protein ABI954_11830, partial [Pyrinomonadaceae bacterium]